jgi:lipopolysaccharide export system permease protein
MRILTRYLVKDYLVTFGLTVSVFTFVMTLGSVIKAIDLLARGVAGGLILQFFALNIPFVLQFTIPMATMTTALLLFTRLSLDGEITALKACGMSLWDIVTPLLWASLLLSTASLWLSGDVSPRSRYAQRGIVARLANTDPLALVEEGKFIRDFPGYLLYVGKRNGEFVEDIVIYELSDNKVRGNVRAKSGRISVDPVNQKLKVDLYEARIDQSGSKGSGGEKGPRSFSAAHYPRELDLKDVFRTGRKAKKNTDRTTRELVTAIRNLEEIGPEDKTVEVVRREKMGMIVEISVRMALSTGCFGFTLLGIPLGIRSRRKESSVGVGLSLGILFLFYFFMILARSMAKFPEWMPDLIVWLPLLLAEISGLILIQRAN